MRTPKNNSNRVFVLLTFTEIISLKNKLTLLMMTVVILMCF